jgi:hypothetical protein
LQANKWLLLGICASARQVVPWGLLQVSVEVSVDRPGRHHPHQSVPPLCQQAPGKQYYCVEAGGATNYTVRWFRLGLTTEQASRHGGQRREGSIKILGVDLEEEDSEHNTQWRRGA